MPTISQFTTYAEVALASYASVATGPTANNNDAYLAAGMAQAQATIFDQHWSALAQADIGDGFSAVLFQDRNTGEKVLGIRGTEASHWGIDYLVDVVGVALLGTAAGLRQYDSLETFYQQLLSTGKLGATEQITLSGHSLGGFLVQAFAAKHDAVVTAAYTYNSPGFSSSIPVGGIGTQLLELFGITDASIPNSKIFNARAIDGVSATSGLGQMIGYVNTFNIESSGAISNHSIVTLTDSLAVQNMLSRLAPSAVAATLNTLVLSASNQATNSLESLLDTTRRLLTGPSILTTPTGDHNALYANLDALSRSLAFQSTAGKVRIDHVVVADLVAQARNDFGAMAALLTLSPMVITATDAANQSLLNAVFQSAWGPTYADWQVDKTMSEADRRAGKGTFTDAFIRDRASLLSGVITASQKDATDFVVAGNLPFGQRLQASYVSNGATQQLLFQSSRGDTALSPTSFLRFGGEQADVLTGGQLEDHLYGGAGADTLNGQGGNDYLEGGAGVDTYIVDANSGFDTIVDTDRAGLIQLGGRPALTGGGQLQRDDATYAVWIDSSDSANSITYSWDKTDGTLFIQGYQSTVLVKNFAPGSLGISVPGNTVNPGNVVLGSVNADILLGSSSQSGFYYAETVVNDRLAGGDGNDELFGYLGDDVLEGGAGNNLLSGGYGNDVIIGGAGRDVVLPDNVTSPNARWQSMIDTSVPPRDSTVGYAFAGYTLNVIGTGNFWAVSPTDMTPNLGAGIPVGDPGRTFADDVIDTGAGNDIVFAGEGRDDAWLRDGDDVAFGGGGADYIEGGAGADLIYGDGDLQYSDYPLLSLSYTAAVDHGADVIDGGGGDDSIYGGGGVDVIYGGGGNDVISGDGQQFSNQAFNIPTALQGDDYIDAGDGNDTVYGFAGSDTIFGGQGNDFLFGDYADLALSTHGDDCINGGAGDDRIEGMGGNDTLDGGDGTDTVIGGAGNDTLMDGGGMYDTLDGGDGDDMLIILGYQTSATGGAGANRYVIAGIQNTSAILNGFNAQDQLWTTSSAANITFSRNSSNLNSLMIKDDVARIYVTIPNFYSQISNGAFGLASIEFGDGVQWTGQQLFDKSKPVATEGDDSIIGFVTDDVLVGLGGQDSLIGVGGSDDFTGGLGNDSIASSDGSAVIHYERGDGRDSVSLSSNTQRTNVIRFGTSVNTQDVILRGQREGLLIVQFSGGLNSYAVEGLMLNDFSATGVATDDLLDRMEFSDGTVWDQAEVRRRITVGTAFDDRIYVPLASQGAISGLEGNDYLYGRVGADTLDGGAGDDRLFGDKGDDIYIGGLGNDDLADADDLNTYSISNDTYRYSLGDGRDSIDDRGGVDTVELGAGILPSDVIVLLSPYGGAAADISISFPDGGSISGMRAVETVRFADGTVWTGQMVSEMAVNRVPIVSNPIADQSVAERSTFSLVVPADAFTDPEAGPYGGMTLTYSASLVGGAALPSWLSFNAGTRTFSGTPANANVGLLQVQVTATDPAGAQASDVFALDVTNVNDLPTVAIAPATQSATQGQAFSWTVPAGTFVDPDAGDALTRTLTRSDGSALPNWLIFNATTGLLAGTPANANVGTLGLRLTATDSAGASVWADFNLVVANVNDAPVLSAALADQSGRAGAAFSYTVPAGAFTDIDIGDTLTYSAAQASGAALPSWLSFNPGTRTFSGTPPAGQTGTVSVRVTARDTAGASVNDVFDLSIALGGVINGTAAGETLNGSAGQDQINGLGGNDTLNGLADNDTLDGGAGNDIMVGGVGNDTYVVDSASDVVTELANEGTDTVQSSVTYSLANNLENLTLTGTAAINGTGNTLGNAITGNSAANALDGGAGADMLIGGAGNDTYVVDNTGDVVTELANEGTDVVNSSVTYTLAVNVENLTLTGTTAINGAGNALDNVLTGNSASNTLTGGAGNDTINGGAGNDTMVGGTGNDTYIVESTSDVITELANEGTDTVQSGVTYILANNVENLTLTGTTAINATGNALNNVLTGNSAANVLTGGAGNDTYYVGTGDTVTEAASAGTDTVISSVTWTLGSNLENLTLSGTSAINGTGNTQANVITGNSATNTLDGGTGADTLSGGAGNDTYVVDNTGDVITELANEGADAVNSSVTCTLAANIENLTLTGTTAINGTGNASDNVLTGNSANNTLTGGAGNDTIDGGTGNDTMIGGTGSDTYTVNVSTDVIAELANEGADTVRSSVTWTLGNNLENLTLLGTTAINGTGNTLDNILSGNSANNTLTGGAGNDTLDGAAGNDTMLGGAGNDIYVVNVTTDVVTENANEGTDTVQSSVAWTLGNNLENLTLTGTTAINGTGNALNNVLLGNAGANTLTGNAGNDTLDGGAGADVLAGGTGNDTYVMGRGYGAETLQENDATAGNADVMQFLSGVSTDQIWLRQVSNNLEVSIIGGTDKVTLTNWYLGNQYHVEQFRTADGHTLLDSSVQNLVNAMAAFAPPAAGQTTLPANYQTALAPVLASSWGG